MVEDNDFSEWVNPPSQESIDRGYLNQLMLDGQMEDDEIDETVEALLEWKAKAMDDILREAATQMYDNYKLLCDTSLEEENERYSLKFKNMARGYKNSAKIAQSLIKYKDKSDG